MGIKNIAVLMVLVLAAVFIASPSAKVEAQGGANFFSSCGGGVQLTVSGWGTALITLHDFNNNQYGYYVNLGAGSSGRTIRIAQPGSFQFAYGWQTYSGGQVIGDATVTAAGCY